MIRSNSIKRSAVVVAGIVALATTMTACSASSTSKGSSSAPISIGIPIGDTASLQAVGIAAPDALSVSDIETMYKAAISKVSGTAAAGGHKLTTDFSSFNLVQAGAPQTSCLHFVQDSKDDVVLSTQFVNGGDQCVVQRGGFLIQNVAAPQAAYSLGAGAVYTMDLVPNDAAKEFANYLTKDSKLKGQTLGVLTDALGGDAAPVTSILVPALKKAGLNVAHVTTLSADLSQVAQQVPVEVSQMKQAGVTTIIDATPSANLLQFLGGAGKVGFNVPIIASDLNNAVDETFAPAYPKTLEATAISARRFSSTDNTAANTCYKNYRAAGGKSLVVGSTNYQQNVQICDSVTLLAAGLAKLGSTSFSKAALETALGKVGSLTFGFYGPSKLSGSSHSTVSTVQALKWDNGGWQPTNGTWLKVSNG